MAHPIVPATGQRKLYGRRLGRPLKANQQDRLDLGLARFGLDLDDFHASKPLDEVFGVQDSGHSKQAYWLEIGFGGGEHLAFQAQRNPDVGLIGAEFYANGVSSACGHLLGEDLTNARILQGDGRELLDRLPDQSLERVFILHPDPWPKKRHHFRRILNFDTLDLLVRVMKPGAELRLATDHADYKVWMLQKCLDHGGFDWQVTGKSDWSQRPDDWPQTRYEAKSLREGRVPMIMRLLKR